jgi:hypothetical protein
LVKIFYKIYQFASSNHSPFPPNQTFHFDLF